MNRDQLWTAAAPSSTRIRRMTHESVALESRFSYISQAFTRNVGWRPCRARRVKRTTGLCGAISTAGWCCNSTARSLRPTPGCSPIANSTTPWIWPRWRARRSPTGERARTTATRRSACFGKPCSGGFAGYDGANDSERLRHDPAMRWIVGGKAATGSGASAREIGRFETRLTAAANLTATRRLVRTMRPRAFRVWIEAYPAGWR